MRANKWSEEEEAPGGAWVRWLNLFFNENLVKFNPENKQN
jgi:hypothetical protein